jgi:hypothetical protein
MNTTPRTAPREAFERSELVQPSAAPSGSKFMGHVFGDSSLAVGRAGGFGDLERPHIGKEPKTKKQNI